MKNYFRSRIGARLLLSYFAIIGVGMVVLIISSQFILPATFNRHMGNGKMMGMMGGNNPMPQLYVDFRASFNEALLYAALAAILAAILLSLLYSRSLLKPVRDMSIVTQRIAEGNYSERVQVNGSDEFAQLGSRFNRMAEKLDQVESMRRRLIGDVSHEMRTPLTAIKGSMEGLMDGVLSADNETYQQIYFEADRLDRLVEDLQELSRVESGAYRLDLRPVDLAAIMHTITKRLFPQADAKRITLKVDLASDLPPVLADEDRIVQILTNLAGNALSYTPDDGRIIISATRVDNEALVSVRDTGIGISAEHLPHIFDRFYRADKSRSRQTGGGSGIGLTIARALVEAHGGRIWAESEGDGKGSTFTFTLPVESA
jgi:histidine kinase